MIDIDLSREAQLRTLLNDALRDFKISAECIDVKINEHLAFFDLNIVPGQSGSSDIGKIRRRAEDIQLRIRSKTVPIVKTIPDRGIVRLQVSMTQAAGTDIEELYKNHTIPGSMMLPIVLGKSDEGERLVVDFAKNPHTLIAGATFSGKSVLLHNIIANMVYLNAMGSRDIQIYLVDPKQVEFAEYEDDSFKEYITEVVSTYDQTLDLLESLESLMESRYSQLKKMGFKSLRDCPKKMSQVVVVIDEVADLMSQDKRSKRFESLIVRLAQKARAAGIHIIMATQRPSVDVITGLIKANFPAKIACRTANSTESRVVMDSVGAENLMGRGDAILKNDVYDKVRFQVAFSDPKTTEKYLSLITSSIA